MSFCVNKTKKFPIGTSDFKRVITDNYYYVDKTKLIKDIIDSGVTVSLFTRPRRFGKSLNLSMLKNYFKIGADEGLFSGLYIDKQDMSYKQFLGRFPVIYLSLKDMDGITFADAQKSLYNELQDVILEHYHLYNDKKLNSLNLVYYEKLLQLQPDGNSLQNGLHDLMRFLHSYYNEKVIVLIDEYDVPLAKAFERNYYDEMVGFIRNLFSRTLKDNDDLQFAVLTGCLRISKESIFTGLNNIAVSDITNTSYQDAFGFTEDEVKALLSYYGLEAYMDIVKEWYDGYHFGNKEIYCPWDVLLYGKSIVIDNDPKPQEFWMNSSSNNIVQHFIDEAIMTDNSEIKVDFLKLVQGQPVNKIVNTNIVYRDLYSSVDSLWSTLFMTGYLTCKDGYKGDSFNLVIPNLEILSVFRKSFIEQFKRANTKYTTSVFEFYNALQNGDAASVKEFFESYLKTYASVRNANARRGKKENFYQGLFLGMLVFKGNWRTKAEPEYGNGYADLVMFTDRPNVGVIVEFKYADSQNTLEKSSRAAVQQIENKQYTEGFFRDYPIIDTVYEYGISCYLSDCDVVMHTRNRVDSDTNKYESPALSVNKVTSYSKPLDDFDNIKPSNQGNDTE